MTLKQSADEAFRLKNFEQAADLYRQVRAKNPYDSDAICVHASALRMAGNLIQADDALGNGVHRFPDHKRLSFLYADSAIKLQLWSEAEERWAEYARNFGVDEHVYVGRAVALYFQGQHEEAERFLTEGLDRFEDHPALLCWLGQVKGALGDWRSALFALAQARTKEPNSRAINDAYGRALYHVVSEEEESDHLIAQITKVSDPESRQLLMRFQSLGMDCELGLLQRHFEAEPLHLMRWSSIEAYMLHRLLKSRFEGVGDPNQMTIMISKSGEYVLHHTPTGSSFHTFLRTTDISLDELKKKHFRRMAQLRDMLISDLESGRTIFVLKGKPAAIEPHYLNIFEAMASYGPAYLLVVIRSNEQPEKVNIVRPGLMLATLNHFGSDSGTWDIDYDAWLRVCKRALDYRAYVTPALDGVR